MQTRTMRTERISDISHAFNIEVRRQADQPHCANYTATRWNDKASLEIGWWCSLIGEWRCRLSFQPSPVNMANRALLKYVKSRSKWAGKIQSAGLTRPFRVPKSVQHVKQHHPDATTRTGRLQPIHRADRPETIGN